MTSKILSDYIRHTAIGHQSPVFQLQNALAQAANGLQVEVDEKNSPSLAMRAFIHLAQTSLLKAGVPDSQHFVYDQDVGLQMRRYFERQQHIHGGRVAFYRRIDKPLHPGEINDLVKVRIDLRGAHPRDRAGQTNALAAG